MYGRAEKNGSHGSKKYLKNNKLTVLESTPEKHDKMMAIVQALNHFNTITLGLALAKTNIPLAEISKFSTPIFPD